MSYQVFISFHKRIFNNYYKTSSSENDKYLTYYGVKDKLNNSISNVIYEYELDHYNPNLQCNVYNESTCIYHIYKNGLYKKYDYVGFCHYDMCLNENFFKNIEIKLENNRSNNDNDVIFYADMFPDTVKECFGGLNIIDKDYRNLPSALKNYNNFFNKEYTCQDLFSNRIPSCNSFIISKRMYEKMMSWLVQYFQDDVDKLMFCEKGYHSNPGHFMEALTGMFFVFEKIEGATYEQLDLKHESYLKYHLDNAVYMC